MYAKSASLQCVAVVTYSEDMRSYVTVYPFIAKLGIFLYSTEAGPSGTENSRLEEIQLVAKLFAIRCTKTKSNRTTHRYSIS